VADLEGLEDALAAFAVEAGFPQRRRLLAGALLSAGLRAADVELLGCHCVDQVEGEANATRVLFALLVGDPEKLRARIADLRACAAARTTRTAAPEFGRALRTQPSDEDLAQRSAYARVVVDRAPVEVVARELGIDVAEVARLVEIERGKRGTPTAPAAKQAETDAARQRRSAEIQSELFDRKRLPATKAESKVIDGLRRLPQATGWILDEIAATGHVNIARMLRDPVRRGAFAELENSGQIAPTGDFAVATGAQPFRTVHDKAQQEAIRNTRRGVMAAELQTITSRMPAAKSGTVA
jgi:hypothetical protein